MKKLTLVYIFIILLIIIFNIGCTQIVDNEKIREDKNINELTDEEILQQFPDGLDQALEELELIDE